MAGTARWSGRCGALAKRLIRPRDQLLVREREGERLALLPGREAEAAWGLADHEPNPIDCIGDRAENPQSLGQRARNARSRDLRNLWPCPSEEPSAGP